MRDVKRIERILLLLGMLWADNSDYRFGQLLINLGVADKCTFCYHRLHKGLINACVEACPRGARICGNLKDENSQITQELNKRRYAILKPEMYTRPKCYYIGLDQEVK